MPGQIRIGNFDSVPFDQFEIIYLNSKHKFHPHTLTLDGCRVTNLWRFSKVYPQVESYAYYLKRSSFQVILSWPEGIHYSEKKLQPGYQYWRETGENLPVIKKHPAGWRYRQTHKFYLEKNEPLSEENPKLDLTEARQKIYLKNYLQAISSVSEFQDLWKRWTSGQDIFILDPKGPSSEFMSYYQEKHSVKEDFILNDSIELNMENLLLFLHDRERPFCIGYALAWCLFHFHPA